MQRKLILASQSPTRKSLLSRLRIEFECLPADIDETPLEAELPGELVKRLAYQKANKIAKTNPDAVVIGADTIAVLDGKIQGKTHDYANTLDFLLKCSNNKLDFMTGVCVIDSTSQNKIEFNDITPVYFKNNTKAQIENYLIKEQPYSFAGAIQIESLSIALIAKIETLDPTGILGLPLIQLCDVLKEFNITVI